MQTRTKTHKLRIEAGRHNNIAIENRLCPECNLLEDEERFLINCRKFNEQREKLYNTVYNCYANFNNLSSEHKKIFLLTSKDQDSVKDVGEFINECMS